MKTPPGSTGFGRHTRLFCCAAALLAGSVGIALAEQSATPEVKAAIHPKPTVPTPPRPGAGGGGVGLVAPTPVDGTASATRGASGFAFDSRRSRLSGTDRNFVKAIHEADKAKMAADSAEISAAKASKAAAAAEAKAAGVR